MNARSTSDNLIVREFTAPKQIKLFNSLREAQISGQLTFSDPIQGTQWHLYLQQGDVVYATGGIHPIRRWQRTLISNLPQIPFNLSTLQQQLTEREVDLNDNVWEYEQITHWVEQQVITFQQGTNAIALVLGEIFFDLTQARQVICRLDRDKILPLKTELIKAEELIERTQIVWQSWEDAKVADRSPNMAPVILQPQKLQQKTSASAYQSLCKLLNGNRTLRDLSVQLRTTSLEVICSLLPYIQSGIFGLVNVRDLLELFDPSNISFGDRERPLIACVDDSLMISQMMEQIITMAGYRFISVNNSADAIPTLVARRPDLIFLDVVMPKVSGYDLCAQLRKYPEFAETPIIFLTSSTGIVDRIKAKMVGSTDFIKKSIDADGLLQKIAEYIP
jgi:chemotaxis family two-component system response regulator PixG